MLGLGALGGAAAGGAIDLAVGGASMLLGTLIGGGIVIVPALIRRGAGLDQLRDGIVARIAEAEAELRMEAEDAA